MQKVFLSVSLILFCLHLYAQQIPDTSFHPSILYPMYAEGSGPVVYIDEGHHNFHTKDGRYYSFGTLLTRDGYAVKSYLGSFELNRLYEGRILVISNALHESNVEDWFLPTPSAFTQDEIKIVHQWVKEGGSLFLIADHMPMAGAAEEFATAFGFTFTNGFVADTTSNGPDRFTRDAGTLHHCLITEGRNEKERVKEVISFTGQAFNIPDGATPLLIFEDRYVNYLPDTAWVFTPDTRVMPAGGWYQGAYMPYGNGRIVVFGEAAMFSAQLAGPQQRKTGMNAEHAKENYQLLLNIIHWLDGKL